MIRLSDVKVRMQYRWRVRQRLMVLHFARLHGPTAAARRFGVTTRTIRRWRVRWRQGGLESLVPRYPRRRGRRITPRVIELVGQARASLHSAAAAPAERQGETQPWLSAELRMKELSESRGATLVSTSQVAGSRTSRNGVACRFGKRGIAPLGGRARARSNCSP